ncbi:ATP-binding protein [Streptomyces ochraceiscleroticus]|uniref:ATP-binding protein n=1 Tax=Streptomyces ochraceiscleroticus TaxID=47761 RepID=A0ABW1MEB9_9ACTN|nr:ATP-binding protein [Streptomyces ochraceiscleroticus]
MFTQRFSSTPRGARLARLLAERRLVEWGIPYGSDAAFSATLIVAELATNAVTHGRIPGRDFELSLTLLVPEHQAPATPTILRIEVSDTRTECRPPSPETLPAPSAYSESGRGLYLVSALADRWTIRPRSPLGKTLVAELELAEDGHCRSAPAAGR